MNILNFKLFSELYELILASELFLKCTSGNCFLETLYNWVQSFSPVVLLPDWFKALVSCVSYNQFWGQKNTWVIKNTVSYNFLQIKKDGYKWQENAGATFFLKSDLYSQFFSCSYQSGRTETRKIVALNLFQVLA